jgi:hypothetical protein
MVLSKRKQVNPMLNQLSAAPYDKAMLQARRLYDSYAAIDNQPGDKDPRPDFVELSGSLGTTHVHLDRAHSPVGYSEQKFGFTSCSQSATNPNETTVLSLQRGSDDSTTDFALHGTEITLRDGNLSGLQMDEKKTPNGGSTFGFPDYDCSLPITMLDPIQASSLFQVGEATAKG